MLVFVLEITSWAKMMSCSQHWTILSMMSTIKVFILSIYCKIFKSIKIRSNSPEKTAHCKKYKTLDGPGCVTWFLFNKLLQPKSYQKEKHIILIVASVCEEAKEWSLLLVVRKGGDGIKSSCRSLLKRSTNAMFFIVPYISKH